jgi:hypothetical protein
MKEIVSHFLGRFGDEITHAEVEKSLPRINPSMALNFPPKSYHSASTLAVTHDRFAALIMTDGMCQGPGSHDVRDLYQGPISHLPSSFFPFPVFNILVLMHSFFEHSITITLARSPIVSNQRDIRGTIHSSPGKSRPRLHCIRIAD